MCSRVLFGAYLQQTDQNRDISVVVVVDGSKKKKKKNPQETESMTAEMLRCLSALHMANCTAKSLPVFNSDQYFFFSSLTPVQSPEIITNFR